MIFDDILLDEFVQVTARPKFKKYFSKGDIESILISLSRFAQTVQVKSKVNICRDPKDDFLLALAKDGSATHLITGDKDLLVLGKIGKTRILTLTKYFEEKKLMRG